MTRHGNWAGVLLTAFLAGLVASAQAQDDAAAPFAVWQLPAGAKLPPGRAIDRTGWRRLNPEAGKPPVLPGGVAMEGPSLLVVVPVGGEGVAVLGKGPGSMRPVRQKLVLVDAKGRPAGSVGGVRLAEFGPSEAVVSFSAGAAEARLKLALGKPCVEVMPGRNCASLRVGGTFRFSFLPDFFGDDVLYDAREGASEQLYLPAESFLVNLLDGHAALAMLVWPEGGGQDVSLHRTGRGDDARFDRAEVSFNGKSIFVGVLAREGIWYGKELVGAATDAVVAEDRWQPPFPAQWMTILATRPRVGASAGLACRTMPVPSLPAGGDSPYSDVYVHPKVPSWFFGRQWRLYLQTALTHMMTGEKVRVPPFVVAINYPRDRTKDTPLDAWTLVDVMLGALGRGPCEYVLDLEGLNKTRSTGAAGTGKPTVAATCATRGGLVYYYLGERSEAFRRDEPLTVTNSALVSVEGIKDFLDAAYGRIQEYLAWSDETVKFAEAAKAKAKDPATRELADRVIAIAREMRQLWDKMVEHDKPCAHPREWQMALEHCKELIRSGAANLGERIAEFDPQMRGAGEEVDGGMQACRLIVKRIRQEAAMSGSTSPAAAELAAALRERCQEVLRNKHYKEGDSVRISEKGAGR